MVQPLHMAQPRDPESEVCPYCGEDGSDGHWHCRNCTPGPLGLRLGENEDCPSCYPLRAPSVELSAKGIQRPRNPKKSPWKLIAGKALDVLLGIAVLFAIALAFGAL